MRIAALCWCATAACAADWKALRPQGYVSDFAGAADLDPASRAEMNRYCEALEKATGAHLYLAILPTLEREPVYDVAHAVLQAWTAGLPDPDNTALLLISVGDRRDALVTGSALAPILDSDAASAVLAETRPALARGEYGKALMAAADEMGRRIAAARHVSLAVRLPRRARRRWADSIPWPLVAGAIPLIVLLVWLLRRPHRRPPEQPA